MRYETMVLDYNGIPTDRPSEYTGEPETAAMLHIDTAYELTQEISGKETRPEPSRGFRQLRHVLEVIRDNGYSIASTGEGRQRLFLVTILVQLPSLEAVRLDILDNKPSMV